MGFEKLTTTYSASKFLIEKDHLTMEDVKKIKDPKVKKMMEEILLESRSK